MRIVSISTLHLTLPIDLKMSKERGIRNINIIPSTSWLALESASFDILPSIFVFLSYSQINRDTEISPIFLMRCLEGELSDRTIIFDPSTCSHWEDIQVMSTAKCFSFQTWSNRGVAVLNRSAHLKSWYIECEPKLPIWRDQLWLVGWLWLWPKIQQRSAPSKLSTPGLPLCLIS